MPLHTLEKYARLATEKRQAVRESPCRFLVSAMMAGAYIGLAIILIYTLGTEAAPEYRHLIMGVSFGIGLTLVVFAGSELFTGQTMYMTIGLISGRTSLDDLVRVWSVSWLGNFGGAVLVALLFTAGGGGPLLFAGNDYLFEVATAKMNAPVSALIARAILCNWLVCLALWTSSRMSGDAAKCIAIFWCLFAFVASGYEHSIANMTVLTLSLLGDHPASVSLAGMLHNLLWVTLGNAIGGAVFMAGAYSYVGRRGEASPAAEGPAVSLPALVTGVLPAPMAPAGLRRTAGPGSP
ncbi:formate/nitrite transporter family protein [Roseicella aquatilis]|uniref:Nitrite transporter NirC n=1 Tax=Roseicella aquatilis TaxID=2527868 RepID=A0A4R4DRH8_9PROT|nr:formate/nitrite transporter family protein [Roseicella aquatilis]TCZ64879.1 nitrite transporter NirC [Roseicella aquatilis]